MSDHDEVAGDLPDGIDSADGDDQRGPWLLALGALAVGVLAFLVSGARSLYRRLRGRGSREQ
ncbi:hypothetical protein ACFPYI_09565 [Halomarina salina]|uniref:Uncharacterized protein n=1 Tax=Halomarina salina TaxID=1872699 RepID=A0ABD5RLV0_9EURY|nr:hypothetical protein [Halomarina salina]